MADRLTQLQDSFEDLLIRMYATLNYIQSYHPYGKIDGQPSQAPSAGDELGRDGTLKLGAGPTNGDTQAMTTEALIKSEEATPGPDASERFRSTLRDLAQDLVLQQQKTELLISQLPGLGNSERDQMKRMQELESELKEVEAARSEAERQKIDILQQLDRMILEFGRPR